VDETILNDCCNIFVQVDIAVSKMPDRFSLCNNNV